MSEKKETTYRISQSDLIEFIARMKVAGFPLEDRVNEAAVMFALSCLGHDPAENLHIVNNKEYYKVSMEGDYIVVTFPAGVEFRRKREVVKGGVLIGCGFMPTQALVQDAIKRGDLKNCTRVTTTELPADMGTRTRKIALAAYIRYQDEKGWDDPGELVVVELTTSQGQKMLAVYPKNP